jgi:hypothetical protein
MIPLNFPEANTRFKAPAGMEESQVGTIPAFAGETKSGSCDGVPCVVVAWLPEPRELEALNRGAPVFLTVLGGLPPHFLTTNFAEATNPA